jgi:perosamine synthetase
MLTSRHASERVLRALERHLEARGDGDATADLAGDGPIRELEERLARYYGAKYAVCVSSATMGLTALALALDLRGAEIVTTPISYGATVAPFLAFGANIVFADVESDTLGLDPAAALRAIGRRTRAIVAVDALGMPSDTRGLRELADAVGVWYIADAAQGLGARRDGSPASSDADALVVSFGAGKVVSVGEGGAIVTNNDDIYRRVVWWTQHPLRHARELGTARINEFALNGRMNGLAAAWANAVFDEALENLKQYQTMCSDILDVLAKHELIAPTGRSDAAILPSFFRLSAKWRTEPRIDDARTVLATYGYDATVGSLPVRLLYHEAAFRARTRTRANWLVRCPIAEREMTARFALDVRRSAVPTTGDQSP